MSKNRGFLRKTCVFFQIDPSCFGMIKTVFFDMDGTLVDTELAAAKAVEARFARWNHQVRPEDAQYVTGRTWEMAVEFLFRKYPPPIPPVEALQELLKAYRSAIETALVEVPGARECVRDLAREFPLALVSGSH